MCTRELNMKWRLQILPKDNMYNNYYILGLLLIVYENCQVGNIHGFAMPSMDITNPTHFHRQSVTEILMAITWHVLSIDVASFQSEVKQTFVHELSKFLMTNKSFNI